MSKELKEGDLVRVTSRKGAMYAESPERIYLFTENSGKVICVSSTDEDNYKSNDIYEVCRWDYLIEPPEPKITLYSMDTWPEGRMVTRDDLFSCYPVQSLSTDGIQVKSMEYTWQDASDKLKWKDGSHCHIEETK